MIESSECKCSVAKEATKRPQRGHQLPAGKRKNTLIMGVIFIACAVLGPLLLQGLGASLPDGAGTWMILLALTGTFMVVYSQFGSFNEKKP